ncbi:MULTISPECIES: ATPase [Mesorhizobium]|uniref:ATPase n=1 Tax=Mesorhizobium australicum TaxID=536018 RepID=UPI003339BEBB
MNSDHEIEVTEKTSAPAEPLEFASETALDHAAAATTVEAADLSDEDGDNEEGDDEDGEESDEDDDDKEEAA